MGQRPEDNPKTCAKCHHVKAQHAERLTDGMVHCRAKGCDCTTFQRKVSPEEFGPAHALEREYLIEATRKVQQNVENLPCDYCGHRLGDHAWKDGVTYICTQCDFPHHSFAWGTPDAFTLAVENARPEVHAMLEEINQGMQRADDPVNHPSHYTAYPGVEVIQLTRHMSFNRGNAVKYTARAGLKDKGTEIQDLEKAVWYLQDEIKLLKGEYNV
jgi:hypothetical protein